MRGSIASLYWQGRIIEIDILSILIGERHAGCLFSIGHDYRFYFDFLWYRLIKSFIDDYLDKREDNKK